MANDSTKVSVGKPKVAGAIYRADASSSLVLPTDATTALAADFKCLGYCSEDGLTNSTEYDTGDIKAWGAEVVYSYLSSKKDTFEFTLIESMNPDVLKAVYGSDNVTVDSDGNITVKANSKEQDACAWVFELVLNGTAKRIVVPSGKVTEVGSVSYKDEEAVGYTTTISAFADTNGNTHYEYIGD